MPAQKLQQKLLFLKHIQSYIAAEPGLFYSSFKKERARRKPWCRL
uniref:Uncharacterized protein n=1 Tax=Anguilla anguilla TaxID=7936 RepID=A0A0E9UCV0_ANGAN